MITPEEALKLILDNTPVLGSETISLPEAVERVLAQDIWAKDDLPPFDNSAMDGYALKSEDVRGASFETPVTLKVKETLKAGAFSHAQVQKGEAIKIMTGVPVPIGADAVVMKEVTSNGDGLVRVLYAASVGENIRPRGEDVKPGDLLLNTGTFLRPYEIGLLAAQGITQVCVVKKPRVSLLVTGDELLGMTEALVPGKIRDSNGPAVAAALIRWGIRPFSQGVVKDDPSVLKKTLHSALESCDVLLVSGGVSVGDFDYTKEILEGLGMKTIFWRVAIKPGKPLLFGKMTPSPSPLPDPLPRPHPSSLSHRERVGERDEAKETLVFGLPGNPVSALVCLEEFVRPALEKLQGFTPKHPSYHLEGILENDYPKDPKRRQYLFCQVSPTNGGFKVYVIRPQGSAMLGMAAKANALALGPIGAGTLKMGEKISFRWLK